MPRISFPSSLHLLFRTSSRVQTSIQPPAGPFPTAYHTSSSNSSRLKWVRLFLSKLYFPWNTLIILYWLNHSSGKLQSSPAYTTVAPLLVAQLRVSSFLTWSITAITCLASSFFFLILIFKNIFISLFIWVPGGGRRALSLHMGQAAASHIQLRQSCPHSDPPTPTQLQRLCHPGGFPVT